MLLWLGRRIVYAATIVVAIAACTYGGLRLLRPDRFPGDSLVGGTLHDLGRAFLHFDLGKSESIPGGPDISTVFSRYWTADLWLLAGGMAIGVFTGVAGGIWCARRPRSIRSRALEVAATVVYCTPVAVSGLMLLLLFNPVFGRAAHLPYFFDADPTFAQPWSNPFDWLRTLLVPWLVLGAPLAAMCLRLTLGQLVEHIEDDHNRTAPAKGLSEWRVLRRHAAPPTFLATGSFVSISIPLLVTNAVLVETVFSVPGFFRYTLRATGRVAPPPRGDPPLDYPLLQAIGLWSAVLIVLLTIAADSVLVRIDPRVRAAGRSPG